jgi:hypothetical protein
VVVLVEFVVVLLVAPDLETGFSQGLLGSTEVLAFGAVAPEVAAAPELSLCGVAACGVVAVAGDAVPVEVFGVALSCVLDGVDGVDGLVVVVVVVLLGVVLVLGVVVVVVLLGVLVLCAKAIVPVSSRLAAKIDAFFINSPSLGSDTLCV